MFEWQHPREGTVEPLQLLSALSVGWRWMARYRPPPTWAHHREWVMMRQERKTQSTNPRELHFSKAPRMQRFSICALPLPSWPSPTLSAVTRWYRGRLKQVQRKKIHRYRIPLRLRDSQCHPRGVKTFFAPKHSPRTPSIERISQGTAVYSPPPPEEEPTHVPYAHRDDLHNARRGVE